MISIMCIGISACGDVGKKKDAKLEKEIMKTFCVGRHLIDFPVGYESPTVTTGIFSESDSGKEDAAMDVLVTSDEISLSEFNLSVHQRGEYLRKRSGETLDVFKLQKKIDDTATIFRIQEIDDAYVSEMMFLRGRTKIVVRLDSYRDQFLQAEKRLLNLFENTREMRMEGKAVSTSGFCLGNIEIAGNFKRERGNFLFRNGKGEDFDLVIDTYLPDDKLDLHSRMSGSKSLLRKFDVNPVILRTRELKVAGMRSQEWLGWINLGEEVEEKTFGFALESMRDVPATGYPSLHLEFDTGKLLEDGSPTRTLISDTQAVQRWDAVVASIRPRRQ